MSVALAQRKFISMASPLPSLSFLLEGQQSCKYFLSEYKVNERTQRGNYLPEDYLKQCSKKGKAKSKGNRNSALLCWMEFRSSKRAQKV